MTFGGCKLLTDCRIRLIAESDEGHCNSGFPHIISPGSPEAMLGHLQSWARIVRCHFVCVCSVLHRVSCKNEHKTVWCYLLSKNNICGYCGRNIRHAKKYIRIKYIIICLIGFKYQNIF